MTQKTQKIVSFFVISLAVIGGFSALIFIVNLDQPVVYFQAAFWIFIYLLFNIIFFFDLHFKKRGSWQRARQKHSAVFPGLGRTAKIATSALWDRFEHLRKWGYLSQWLHFLLIPAFIFWASVSLFYISLGYLKIQATIALLSATALIFYYMYIKEIFFRQKEKADSDIFMVLSMVKIYAAGVLFAAALSMLRYNCLPAWYFSVEVFCYTFLLIYLALYQHRLVNMRDVFASLVIALIMAAVAQFVYIYWGYNYFTAAVFMTAIYNLLWEIFHYFLDRTLSKHALLETFLVTALVVSMIFSVTNFKAKIFNGCNYLGMTKMTKTT